MPRHKPQHEDVDDVFDDLQCIIRSATSAQVRERCDREDLHYLDGFIRWASTTGHDVPHIYWDQPEEEE